MPRLPVCIAGLYFDNEMAGRRSEWGISRRGKELAFKGHLWIEGIPIYHGWTYNWTRSQLLYGINEENAESWLGYERLSLWMRFLIYLKEMT